MAGNRGLNSPTFCRKVKSINHLISLLLEEKHCNAYSVKEKKKKY